MPRCDIEGWVISKHRAWIFYASKTVLGSHSRGLCRTATFAPWGKLSSLLTSRQPTTRSTGLSSRATGPDGILHAASGHSRLQVRHQNNRRAHQVDRRLLVDQQEPSFLVASTVRWLDGHSLWRPHRTLVRRQGWRVHQG